MGITLSRPTDLEDLGDVIITSIATGEILKWNGTDWINQTLAEAGIAAASLYLPLTGGTMTGAIDFDNSFANAGGSIAAYDFTGREILIIEAGNGSLTDSRILLHGLGDSGSPSDMHLYSDSFEFYNIAGTLSGSLSSSGVLTAVNDIRTNSDQIFFDYATATDNYIQMSDTSTYFRVVQNGTEDFRVTNAGYIQAGGRRLYMGIGSNDYLGFEDTNNTWSIVSDNGARFTFGHQGMKIYGLDPYTTMQAWLTLDSPGGGNYDDQVAGITVGESGMKGDAAMHFIYTGDGRGHIGMSTVTNVEHPMVENYFKMAYNSRTLWLNPDGDSNIIYLINMATTTGNNTIRQSVTTDQIYYFNSSREYKDNIVDLDAVDLDPDLIRHVRIRRFDDKILRDAVTGELTRSTDKRIVGVIAEEQYEVFGEEAVTRGKQGEIVSINEELMGNLMIIKMQDVLDRLDTLELEAGKTPKPIQSKRGHATDQGAPTWKQLSPEMRNQLALHNDKRSVKEQEANPLPL